MSSYIHLAQTSVIKGIAHELPSSKSISNRALILNRLNGNLSIVNNLSSARDTQLMQRLIDSPDKIIDVMDAGTTMRFLTAYFTVTNQPKVLTGTARMKERPIGLLVDALRSLGAEIKYLEREGFPPIEIESFSSQKKNEITIPGDVSSQYISALMMIGPKLPQGLTLRLTGNIGSIPYIKMTAALMLQFGVKSDLDFSKGIIQVNAQNYKANEVTIEADWSAASYWFSFVALAKESHLVLPAISSESLQGDRVIIEIMDQLGVHAQFKNQALELSKKEHVSHLDWDFKDCPDLAQTVFPLCAAKGISGRFTGLESLRIKETDRIAALQNELTKIGARLEEQQAGVWHLSPGQITTSPISIKTYHDHRMAMGFAPWAALADLTIESPEVVNKSYPGFWRDVAATGVETIYK